MPFGAALSVHPVSSHATGEVIGQVVEEVGPHPDVAILLVTPGHAGALEDVARAVRELLVPGVLIAATAPALVGQGADDGGGAAMALWAGVTGPVRPFRLGPSTSEGRRSDALGSGLLHDFEPSGVVVLGDHSGSDPVGLLDGLDGLGGQRGAVATGALTRGGPLVLDDRILIGGAVGVAFGRGVRFEAVVARGWRPIGPELVVTEADVERGLVLGLDGVPALTRLIRLATDEVPAAELVHINRSLGLGPDGVAGAAAVAEVRGADRSNGAIAAGFPADGGGALGQENPEARTLAVGTTVRFWVRGDPAVDLRRVLAGRDADTAVAFVADPTTRGYGAGDHDAEIIADALGISRVVGLVAPVQIATVGHRPAALAGEASVALLADR